MYPTVVNLNYGKHIVGIKQWHEKSGKIAQKYQFIYSDQSTSDFDDSNLKDGKWVSHTFDPARRIYKVEILFHKSQGRVYGIRFAD